MLARNTAQPWAQAPQGPVWPTLVGGQCLHGTDSARPAAILGLTSYSTHTTPSFPNAQDARWESPQGWL